MSFTRVGECGFPCRVEPVLASWSRLWLLRLEQAPKILLRRVQHNVGVGPLDVGQGQYGLREVAQLLPVLELRDDYAVLLACHIVDSADVRELRDVPLDLQDLPLRDGHFRHRRYLVS